MIYKKFSKHACVLSKDLNKLGIEWAEIKNVLGQVCKSKKEMCNSQKEILNSVQDLAHDQQRISMSSQALPPNVITTVMVISGRNENTLGSVEVLYPGSQTWTVLQSMRESCGSAASVMYGKDVIVIRGRSIEGCSDTIERLSLVCKLFKWIPFPVKLPLKICGHKVVVNLLLITVVIWLVVMMGEILMMSFIASYFILHIP
jgi:hypothetical protein